MKKVIALTLLATLLFGCKPDVSFTTDSAQYGPGEIIHFTNTSKKGKKYKWTFPNGTTSTSENPIFIIPSNQPLGTITVKLEASSIAGIRHAEIDRTLSIGGTGNVTFWSSSNWNYYVTVDGNQTEYASSMTLNTPACGETYLANFTLPVGSHTYKIIKGSSTLGSGTVVITRNNCLAKQF